MLSLPGWFFHGVIQILTSFYCRNITESEIDSDEIFQILTFWIKMHPTNAVSNTWHSIKYNSIVEIGFVIWIYHEQQNKLSTLIIMHGYIRSFRRCDDNLISSFCSSCTIDFSNLWTVGMDEWCPLSIGTTLNHPTGFIIVRTTDVYPKLFMSTTSTPGGGWNAGQSTTERKIINLVHCAFNSTIDVMTKYYINNFNKRARKCHKFFSSQFCFKPYVPREPWRDPSNRGIYHGIYIRHCQESNSQLVPSQAGADIIMPEWSCWNPLSMGGPDHCGAIKFGDSHNKGSRIIHNIILCIAFRRPVAQPCPNSPKLKHRGTRHSGTSDPFTSAPCPFDRHPARNPNTPSESFTLTLYYVTMYLGLLLFRGLCRWNQELRPRQESWTLF